MMLSAEAIIYLAEQRGCTQSDWHRSFHTFSFGNYYNENKKPFGAVNAFNDETLRGGHTLTLAAKDQTVLLLLPLVGAVNYNLFSGANGSIEAGEAHILSFAANTELQITNPFDSELVNFLHIWLAPQEKIQWDGVKKLQFDLSNNKDQLISLCEGTSERPAFHIGSFNGRSEGVLRLKDSNKGIFVFVIDGAFEVQNRLMQYRDGLAVWNTNEIEFEALSNDAIILMIE
jgi:hypothetical protein